MEYEINELIETRFTDNEGRIIKYDDNQVCIINAIDELLSNDMAVKEHSIDMDIVFENPGCELSYLSIAYICGDRLEHAVYIVEVC